MQNGYTAKCKHLFEQNSLGFPYSFRCLGLLSLCLLQALHIQPYYQPLEANNQNGQLWGQSGATSLYYCGLENHSHSMILFPPRPIRVIEVNLVNLLLPHLLSST